MPVSANIDQTPVSGKYGRVFVSINGSILYPINLNRWSMNIETDDIDTTGFEDAGWGNGITGVVRASLELDGPYQVFRTTGIPAPGMQILVPGRFFYYQLFILHPDYKPGYNNLLRFSGVAQVISTPHDQELRNRTSFRVSARSRGKIFFPGQAETHSPQQLLTFYSTGILSNDIPA